MASDFGRLAAYAERPSIDGWLAEASPLGVDLG
jgi:hypothetical protein